MILLVVHSFQMVLVILNKKLAFNIITISDNKTPFKFYFKNFTRKHIYVI